jgi:hypothetical protein
MKIKKTTRVFVLNDGSKVWTNYNGCAGSTTYNWNILTYPDWRSEGPSIVEIIGGQIVRTWCCGKCGLAMCNDLVGPIPGDCDCD